MLTKKCEGVCEEHKAIAEFEMIDRKGRAGHGNICKSCREYEKEKAEDRSLEARRSASRKQAEAAKRARLRESKEKILDQMKQLIFMKAVTEEDLNELRNML